ncbi:hypothetical protein [Psychrobacter sp. JCM 18901]|uniref:hypothetical protein n=1 Tax=Psychrobacter sp. JCM 18901 TaxID=1298609 RepID=UPI0004AC93F7|nr:hypothetical protein [Psychrobacter sp. JCM 18901]
MTPVIASEKPRPDTNQKVAPKEPLPKPKVDNSAVEAQRQAAAQAESERQARKAEQEAQARQSKKPKGSLMQKLPLKRRLLQRPPLHKQELRQKQQLL